VRRDTNKVPRVTMNWHVHKLWVCACAHIWLQDGSTQPGKDLFTGQSQALLVLTD